MDMRGTEFLDSPQEGSVIEGSFPSYGGTLETTADIRLSEEVIRGRTPLLLERGREVFVFVTESPELGLNPDFYVRPARADDEDNLRVTEGAVWAKAALSEDSVADNIFGIVQLREGTRLLMDGYVFQNRDGGGIRFSEAPVVTTTPMICTFENRFQKNSRESLSMAA